MNQSIINRVKKEISIPTYFNEIVVQNDKHKYSSNVNFNIRPVVNCCLHDEDTPSFRYYESTNSFYCFGCGAGGDVIQLHRKYVSNLNSEEIGYEKAVQFLFDFFLLKKEVNLSKNLGIESVEKSSVQDRVRVSKLYREADTYLNMENISLDVKFKLWELVDDIVLLVNLNHMDAKEAYEYLLVELKNIKELGA